MNRRIYFVLFASIISICPALGVAAETPSSESALPPSGLPGGSQAQGAESNNDKASKKGEEAARGNSGADAKSMERDAATSSGKKADPTKQHGKKHRK